MEQKGRNRANVATDTAGTSIRLRNPGYRRYTHFAN